MTSEKAYATEQRLNSHITSNHPVSYIATGGLGLGAAQQTVPGLVAPLGIGTYRVEAQIILQVPGTAGQGQLSFRLHASGGLVASAGRTSIVETHAANGVGASDFAVLDTAVTGATPGTGGANQIVKYSGVFVISTAGNIEVQAAQAATQAVTVLQYPSYLDIWQVT